MFCIFLPSGGTCHSSPGWSHITRCNPTEHPGNNQEVGKTHKRVTNVCINVPGFASAVRPSPLWPGGVCGVRALPDHGPAVLCTGAAEGERGVWLRNRLQDLSPFANSVQGRGKTHRQCVLLNQHLLYVCILRWEWHQIQQHVAEMQSSVGIKSRIMNHCGSKVRAANINLHQ